MASKNNPCNVIKMDKFTNTIHLPSIILMNRNGKKYGKLRYDNYKTSFVGVGVDEISFDVHKCENGKENPLWDKIVDLKVVEVEDFGRFQIQTSYTDNTETVKSVTGQSLEVELSQLYLNEFHINDDEDMDMEYNEYTEYKYDDNGKFIPVVFYNPENEMRSLLHLVLRDKAPHWTIGHIPKYLTRDEYSDAEPVNKFQRTYTEDGTDIYSFLNSTVAEESNVVFVFDTINRIINCYSLLDCYITSDTGEKILVESAIGEDTTIFVSKQNLVQEISIENKQDEVKNCFRVTGGDDIINSRIAAANLNGTNYIWKFSPFQLEDMSEDLVNAIVEYQALVSSDEVKDEYYGENGIYTRLIDLYKQQSYIEHSKMPESTIVQVGTAEEQWNKLKNAIQGSYVYVNNLSTYNANAHVGVDNMVEEYLNILIDSRYELEIMKDNDANKPAFAHTTTNNGAWSGKIKLIQKTNESNVYPVIADKCERFKILIRDSKASYTDGQGVVTSGEVMFAKQKLEKALYNADMSNIVFQETESSANIETYFEQYSLVMLKSFRDGYDSCRSILMTEINGISDNVTKKELESLYKNYTRIFNIIEKVIKHRQSELDTTNSKISNTITEQKKFQEKYNFQSFLENKKVGLYKEFSSYRREDNYNNSNYISDNLETEEELMAYVKNLLDDANKELDKACMLNRTVSTTLNNLLLIPEFEKLYDKFALFNYIRVKTDDEILKLRIMGIEFNGDKVENIGVTFSEKIERIDGTSSDLQNIINSAQSIATSYSATVKQAKQGNTAKTTINNIITNGLNAAKTLITNDDSEEITVTSAGINCKRNDGSGSFGDKQLRIIGNGIYLTDDNWNSIREAIGEIKVNGQEYYGIIAEALVGKLIMGENLIIGDDDANVKITKDGIVIKDGSISWEHVNTPKANQIYVNDTETVQKWVNDYDEKIPEIDAQLDKKAETWYKTKAEMDTIVAGWSNDDKQNHIGDLWFKTDANAGEDQTFIYTYNTSKKIYEWTVQNGVPKSVFDMADGKASIYVSKPSNYKMNDLWILDIDNSNNTDSTYPKYKNGTLLTSKEDNTSYSVDDWIELVKYSNEISSVNNTLIGYVDNIAEDLQKQIDNEITSWFYDVEPQPQADETKRTPNPPASNWITDAEKIKHEGDLYYNSSSGAAYRYIYDKDLKLHIWTRVTDEAISKALEIASTAQSTADSKCTTFTTQPSKYDDGDLWVLSAVTTLLSSDGKSYTYTKGTVLTAVLPIGVDSRTSFVSTDWVAVTTYSATQALQKFTNISSDSLITPTEKQQLKMLKNDIVSDKSQIDKQCSAYSITSTANTKYKAYIDAYNNLYTVLGAILTDMTTDTTDATVISNYNSYLSTYFTTLDNMADEIESASKKYAESQASAVKGNLDAFQDNVKTVLGLGESVMTKDSVIAPKIGGGYGYFVDGNNYIILNPSGGTVTDKDGKEKTSDNMVEVISNNKDVLHIDKSGNLSMTGNVNASRISVKGSYRITSKDYGDEKNEVRVLDIVEDEIGDTCKITVGRPNTVGDKIKGINYLAFIDGFSGDTQYHEAEFRTQTVNIIRNTNNDGSYKYGNLNLGTLNATGSLNTGNSLHILSDLVDKTAGIKNDLINKWLVKYDSEWGIVNNIGSNTFGNMDQKASINCDGRLYKNKNTSTYFVTEDTGSDRRLKEHRGDLTELEELYMDFKPIEYNYHKGLYNDNPKIEFGFYAQDVIDNFNDKGIDWHDYRLVSKDAIDISSEERKYLDDTCPDGIYRLAYNNMIAFNTHMIQKALRKIEALEERCSLLEEQNELLKQEIEALKKESN